MLKLKPILMNFFVGTALSLLTSTSFSYYAAQNDIQPYNLRAQANAIHYRSDSEITNKVKTRLMTDKETKHLKITIKTKDAMVELSGQVKSEAQKDRVVELTREIKGVKLVIDDLTIED